MARFLRFAVERSLAGRADELKEYLIGVEVFDRPSSYDPRVDPIVRVEARRLRSKLKDYYDGDGKNDPVLIEFSTGGYAPQICIREDAPAAEPEVNTMAVLPFSNLSGNPENDYLSDGLTEELIHALTKFSGMRVVAWNSAARLRGVEQDINEVRRQLKVANLLTGSVRISGASLRVRAQLIDTDSGVYLWSETFDREMKDVFAIQEEIAGAIVRTLHGQLVRGAESALAARTRTTVSSYDYYLKGRYHLHRRSPDELARSLEAFQAAVAADPASAVAQSGLADAYTLCSEYGVIYPEQGIQKARAAAMRAIELDPGLAEAYPSLALIRSHCDWEWAEAEALYGKGIALNPGYAMAHHWLGTDCLALVGRFEEGLREVEIALELDPLSSIIHECRAFILMLQGRHEEAIRRYREILEFDPSFYKAYTSMGRALAQQSNYTQALEMLEKGRSIAGDMGQILAAIGQVFGRMGDRGSARGVLAQLTARSGERYIPCTCFALVHLGLGERERALDWLEKGCEQREMSMCSLKVHPVYDDLRGEPRFQALLKRLRFP